MAKILLRLLIALAALAAALALTEGALRLTDIGRPRAVSALRIVGESLGIDVTVPDDDLLVRLRPGAEFLGYYRINGRGWRGAEPADPKPTDTLRIVALGDSCTFGYGVDESQAWPAQLQHMLDLAFAGVQRFEVISTGVPGYSTWQNRLQMQGDVATLEPDLVVLYPSGHNDITGNKGRTDRKATAFNNSLLSSLSRSRVWRLLSRAPSEDDREVLPPGLEGVGWRVPPDEIRQNLLAMADEAAASGATLLMVAPAHDRDAHAATPAYAAFGEQVRLVARERGLSLADPGPIFWPHPPRTLFVDPVHPNEQGAAWIAFSVLSAMVRSDAVLPASPRRDFLRAWLDARQLSLAAVPGSAFDSGAPPIVRSSRTALQQVQPNLMPTPPVPELVARFDPLSGDALPMQREGALSLLARTETNTDLQDQLAWKGREAAAYLVPDDGFLRLLGAGLPDLERLALARALAVFECALGLPLVPHDIRIFAAATFEGAGHVDKAVAALQSALALRPRDPGVLMALARVLRRNGRGAEAREIHAQLVALAPDAPDTLVLRAQGAAKQGHAAEAEALLRAALAQRPSHADAHYLLGRVLMQSDRLAEAEAALGAARAFGETHRHPDLIDLLQQLAARRAASATPSPSEAR